MEIGKEIQTEKFVDEYHKATINLVFTSNWLTNELEARAAREDITLHQFNVLRILRGRYPEASTVASIKERMIERKSDVSRIVDRLVAKGMVHRCKSSCDGRAVALTITDAGLAVLYNLDQTMLLHDFLTPNLTEEECSQLNHLLDKLRG